MKEQYLYLPQNGDPKIIEIDPDHLLKELHKYLNCDMIEIVHVKHGILIIDETAKLKGKHCNVMASIMYRGLPYDYIAGDAILGKEILRNGEPDIGPMHEKEYKKIIDLLYEIYER